MYKKLNLTMLKTLRDSNIFEQLDGRLIFTQRKKAANQHLFITSDEPRKKGDWQINFGNQNTISQLKEDGYKSANSYCKKIIATTDPILLVQGLENGKIYNIEAKGTKFEPTLVPQIPEEFVIHFITMYNNFVRMPTVEVEYVNSRTGQPTGLEWDEEGVCDEWVLKLNNKNEISIKMPTLCKYCLSDEDSCNDIESETCENNIETYSRVEVVDLFNKMYATDIIDANVKKEDYNNWIINNLR